MNLSFGEYEFDRDAMRLTRNGRVIPLEGKPLELLALLLEKPGIAVTREDIRRRLWPDVKVDFDPTLSLTVSRLNAALGHAPFIEEVPRIGYRFKAATMAPRITSRRTVRGPNITRIVVWIVIIAAIVALIYTNQERIVAFVNSIR